MERRGGLPVMQRHVAERMECHWKANRRKLSGMFVLFALAVVALGAEVVSWGRPSSSRKG